LRPADGSGSWFGVCVARRRLPGDQGAIARYRRHRRDPPLHPVVLAQQVATLEILAPGRAFLGVGSSEAMNEVPAGLDPKAYPAIGEQIERMEESVTIIKRLLDGETVTFDGKHFRTYDAKLYSLPERRPPIYMSAFGEQAAEVAGRLADGLWTVADPRQAPAVIAG
jgi:coenzyme F420-dependent glucose-6-phosphate dehydrogenase